MELKINSQNLFENVPYLRSPNIGDPFPAGQPDTIIVHYTACADATRAIAMLSDPVREVSAHLVVDQLGGITQLVPFDLIAWHAGKSSWQGRESLNKYSIGIEIANAGPLTLKDKTFHTWDNLEINSKEVEARINENSHLEYWHKFPKDQILSVKDICSSLINRYGIKEILAHSEIAPGRKIDPGPVFPIDFIRSILGSKQ